jgi:hypothetical protein
MTEGSDKVLSERDKSKSMSDTIYARDLIKEAFPSARHGSVIAAQCAAYTLLSRELAKKITLRRIRSIWEGKARRIDNEEAAALRRAKLDEARREQFELRQRLSRLDAELASLDADLVGGKGA